MYRYAYGRADQRQKYTLDYAYAPDGGFAHASPTENVIAAAICLPVADGPGQTGHTGAKQSCRRQDCQIHRLSRLGVPLLLPCAVPVFHPKAQARDGSIGGSL